ncbi:hypothetical protein EVAR_39276_1 [Eumeta japonica]|uniref:Uncharacterized protein n=1 Tax=Eumeta variegata TaxID=151549 RepID=A0A4C1VY92_EUMVA|nr:hypothetical protein EVAR_39276_1 [Eumeta japonica]
MSSLLLFGLGSGLSGRRWRLRLPVRILSVQVGADGRRARYQILRCRHTPATSDYTALGALGEAIKQAAGVDFQKNSNSTPEDSTCRDLPANYNLKVFSELWEEGRALL